MKRIFFILVAAIISLSATACGNTGRTVKAFINGQNDYDTLSISENNATNTEVEAGNEDAVYGSLVCVSFKSSDFFFDYEQEEYSTIRLAGKYGESDNKNVICEAGIVTITAKGIYVLSGSYEGTIVIDVTEDENVYLVLDNVTIEGIDGPAICAESAGKLIVMLPESSVNVLSDASKYSDTADTAPNAALFARCNLTVNGSGTLKVYGNNNNAILSKDKCKIMSGNITVESADDGIVGRDLCVIAGGVFNINSTSHALKTSNDEDADKGDLLILNGSFALSAGEDAIHSSKNIEICGGNFEILAGDDAVHADNHAMVNGGTINVTKCYEGLEGLFVTVNGGNINIVATDDGINAANGDGMNDFPGFMNGFRRSGNDNFASADNQKATEENETPCVYINGGKIIIDADGDGIDSNGNIEMSGGCVLVNGPSDNANNATDYNGTFLQNGGVIVAIGSSMMYQSVSKGSLCAVIDYLPGETVKESTKCYLYDEDTLLFDFTVNQNSDAIMIAGDCLEAGKSYILKINDKNNTVTASEASSQENSGGPGGFGRREGFGGPGGFGGQGGFGGPGNQNDFEPPQFPNDRGNGN